MITLERDNSRLTSQLEDCQRKLEESRSTVVDLNNKVRRPISSELCCDYGS